MQRGNLALTAILSAIVFCVPEAHAQTSTRPNIIVMMADDMGWGDIDFAVRLGEDGNGNDINYNGTDQWSTPNLAAMSSNGLTFSRMYSSSPVCSPTRASVMTGRSPERMGIPFANNGKMENREVTMAEYAKSLGYTTGHFGKWHLGVFTRDINDANRGGNAGSHALYSTPLNNGFDVQYSTESKTSTYDPGTSGLTTNTRYWTGPEEFIPLNAAELQGDDSAIIARETNEFIEQAAQNDEPFLAVSWFHTPHKPTNTPGNTNVNNLAAYKFAMEDLDAAVGEIRSKVQELGIADNTILMFTSDNGPEDGQEWTSEDLKANKRELYEGGVRVPGLIEWQGQITPGVTHTPMVTTDYLPTLLEIWNAGPVDDRPMDGQSMVETIFTDRTAVRDKTIIFKSTNGHQSAMGVDGRYKLISLNNGTEWTLYDIVNDHNENDPLATSANIGTADAATQAIYNQLLAEYQAWEISVDESLAGNITGDYDDRLAMLTNAILQAEPPENLETGSVTDNSPLVYLERQFATIDEALAVDSDGSAGSYGIGDSATVAAETTVHSFLVHFNPTQAAAGETQIVFADPIVGVISESTLLAGSDELSFADPNFEAAATRGLEGDDAWTISEDGLTITFNFATNANALDQVRILTEAGLNNTLLEGDLNFDGQVTPADWAIYKANFGATLNGIPSLQAYALGDLNDDGAVDHSDFVLFRDAYNAANGPGAFRTLVPEPATLVLLVLPLALGTTRRR